MRPPTKSNALLAFSCGSCEMSGDDEITPDNFDSVGLEAWLKQAYVRTKAPPYPERHLSFVLAWLRLCRLGCIPSPSSAHTRTS